MPVAECVGSGQGLIYWVEYAATGGDCNIPGNASSDLCLQCDYVSYFSDI